MSCEQGQAWVYREEQRALGVVRLIGIGIIALIVACLLVMCGCATYDRIAKYVPASPITISSGGLDILHVLEINVGASLHNPFAESAKDTTVTPPVVEPPAPPVVPEIDTFANPDCGPSLPDTHSEEFRWKYQDQKGGHQGDRWRVKIAWPSYAVHHMGATRANSVTMLHLSTGAVILPVYALDGGEKEFPAGTPASEKPARPNSEWFDPDTSEKDLRVELWISGKLAMRTTVGNVAAQYQGPLQERINY